jgi:circadian clock protein KaiA
LADGHLVLKICLISRISPLKFPVLTLFVTDLPVSNASAPAGSGQPGPTAPRLLVCLFLSSQALTDCLKSELHSEQYRLLCPQSAAEFFQMVEQNRQHIDCLVLQDCGDGQLAPLVRWLQQATLLPAVLLSDLPNQAQGDLPTDRQRHPNPGPVQYHAAQVVMALPGAARIGLAIDRAISEFLTLPPIPSAAVLGTSPGLTTADLTSSGLTSPGLPPLDLTTQDFLMQQRRLAEKLKERLGYLGVYYKRSPRNFLRNMAPDQQAAFLAELKEGYREIILAYFSEVPSLNQKIDNYIDIAFFADISVAQVVEIHMELMGEFSKQLKLEGRSEEVLLDYRLTLIDTLAHLCEMYRRSIPQESPNL